MANPLSDLIPENPLVEMSEQVDPLAGTKWEGREMGQIAPVENAFFSPWTMEGDTYLDVMDFIEGVNQQDKSILQRIGSDATSFVVGATAGIFKKNKLGITPEPSEYLMSAMEVGLPAVGNLTRLMMKGSGRIGGGVAKSQRGIIGSDANLESMLDEAVALSDPDFLQIRTQAKSLASRQVAMDLASKGKLTDDEIFQRTGWWYDDVNEAWRFEINDKAAKIKGGWVPRIIDKPKSQLEAPLLNGQVEMGTETLSLDEFLDHPQLFNNYPFLKHIPVTFKYDIDDPAKGAATFTEWKDFTDIEINLFHFKHLYGDAKVEEVMSTLLHEIQHTVQRYDELLTGGNHTSILKKGKDKNITEKEAFDIYSRLFGEAEARLVQARFTSDRRIGMLERQISNRLSDWRRYKARLDKAGPGSLDAEALRGMMESEMESLRAARQEIHALKNYLPHNNFRFIERGTTKDRLIPKTGGDITGDDIIKAINSEPAEPVPVLQDKLEDGVYQGEDGQVYQVINSKIEKWQP